MVMSMLCKDGDWIWVKDDDDYDSEHNNHSRTFAPKSLFYQSPFLFIQGNQLLPGYDTSLQVPSEFVVDFMTDKNQAC